MSVSLYWVEDQDASSITITSVEYFHCSSRSHKDDPYLHDSALSRIKDCTGHSSRQIGINIRSHTHTWAFTKSRVYYYHVVIYRL